MLFVIFPCCFQYFSLYLIFLIWLILAHHLCLGFILYGTLCASCTWVALLFPLLEKFIYCNLFKYILRFFLFFFFSSSSSSSEAPIIPMLVSLMLPQKSETVLVSFYSFTFSLFFYSVADSHYFFFHWSFRSVHLSDLLPQLFCHWFLLKYFSNFSYCIFHLFAYYLVTLGLVNLFFIFLICDSIHFPRSWISLLSLLRIFFR